MTYKFQQDIITNTINIIILRIIRKEETKIESLKENEILLALYKGQKEIKEQLKVIPEMQEQLKAIPEMQEQLKAIPEMQEQIKEIKQELKEIPKIKEELRRISGAVARIEVEHGEKLAMLFDAFTVHSEKLDSHEKRISSCENQIEKQDDQIYYLKSKVQGL